MESSKELYCVCGQPYDEKRFMIQCDNCREWYHGNCVNVREYVSIDLDKYHCPQCEVTCGPSVFKKQYNYHRHNYTDMEAKNKPVQTGTPVFIEELKTRHFPSADPVVTRLKGHQLTLNYLHQNGFDQPIIVDDKEDLDIRVPSDYFTVQDVEALVGSDREVDVIDVARQSDIKMRVGDFVNYFNNPMRQRVLNLISLEFSNTKLSELVEAPLIARKLDWVNSVWPLSIGSLPTVYKRPEVQKYCLIGVKDSYTDFHIDFGGTSVWYHVLRGEKIFYLIKPTMANLSLYQRWMTSSTQHETFFGDQVDCCYRCIVQAGHTMMIPTGWIHAVLTPVDTLVFGGNFLHSLNIPMQLQIYEIEKKIRTPERFRFPAFETINWYAAKQLCEELKMLNDESSKVPAYLLQGVKALLFTLKQWSQDRDTNKSRKEEIPVIIDSPKLLKDLSKEIRHAEKFLNSLHPPKPERESKRKKKKPVNKDFVDYSQPQNSILLAQVMGQKCTKNEKLTSDRIYEIKGANRRSEVAFSKLDLNSHNGDMFNTVKEQNKKSPKSTCTSDKQIDPRVNLILKKPLRLNLPKPLTYPYKHSSTFFKTEDGLIQLKYLTPKETHLNILPRTLPVDDSKSINVVPFEEHDQSNVKLQSCSPVKKIVIPAQEIPAKEYRIEGPSKSQRGPLPRLLVHLFNTTSEPWWIVEGPTKKKRVSSVISQPAHTVTQPPQDSERKSSVPNQLNEKSHTLQSHLADHSYVKHKHLDTCSVPKPLEDHKYVLCSCYSSKHHISSPRSSSIQNMSDKEKERIKFPTSQSVVHDNDTSELINEEYCSLAESQCINLWTGVSSVTKPVMFESVKESSNTILISKENSEAEYEKYPNKYLTEKVLFETIKIEETSCTPLLSQETLGADNEKYLNKNLMEINLIETIKTEETSDIPLLAQQGSESEYEIIPNKNDTVKVIFESIKIEETSFTPLLSEENLRSDYEEYPNRNLTEINLFEPIKTEETSDTPLISQEIVETEYEKSPNTNLMVKVVFETIKTEETSSTPLRPQKTLGEEYKKYPNINLMEMPSHLSCSVNDFITISEDAIEESVSSSNLDVSASITSNIVSIDDSRSPHITMKMEPKEPIKLNMKMLSKKLQIKEDPVVRPPLKLTLPKPVTYPYTTPLCENKQKKEDIVEQPGAENKSWFIAMDRSPHVKMKTEIIGLKVKLAKQGELPFINLPPNPPVHQSYQEDYLDQKHQIDSVYDFHDDEDFPDDEDDNCLTIDESPKKRRWSKGSIPVEQSSSSLKAKWAQANHSQIHLNNLLMNLKGMKSDDLNSVDVTSNLPKNGIDELLKASGYTRDESPRIEDLESGRTSPSTREAIAGMLSISRMYQVDGEGEPSSSHNGTPRAKKRKHHVPHVDEVEDIDKVHQDDDFIYPSLDLSDEEEERTTRGGKRKIDEAWNPKARVGHVAPKTDRPCREGAKKQSVEKGLEAAAAKRASLPSPKRPYHRKKPKFVPLAVEQPSSSHSSLLPSSSIRPVTTTTTTATTIDLKNRKPKKGMATAKQRLGKILKLHKMYH